MTIMERPASASENQSAPDQDPKNEQTSNKNKKIGRRAAIGGIATVLVGGAGYGIFQLGKSSNEAPVASPEPKPVDPTTEPAPEPTTEEPTEPVSEFVYPFEEIEYGGIPNGLSQEEFNAQMEIPAGLSVDELGQTIINRMNTALMYGASPEFVDTYIENFTPDEAGLDWFEEFRSQQAEKNIEGLAVALYGSNWEVDSERYELVQQLRDDIKPVIVENLRGYLTSVGAAENIEGHPQYIYQLDFVGTDVEFESAGDVGFSVIANISENTDDMADSFGYKNPTPEYPNSDTRRSYRVVVEDGAGSGEGLRIEPNWDSGEPAYDSNNMTIPIPFI